MARCGQWGLFAANFPRRFLTHALVLTFLGSLASGCTAEKRHVGPAPPESPPTGRDDSRQTFYETNLFQQGEGARLFRWSGCDSCHTETSTGAARLTDDAWAHGGTTSEIYRAIAGGAPGMPAYEKRLTAQQLWQISGYVKTLHETKSNMRYRSNAAQQGEPSGASWQGALR